MRGKCNGWQKLQVRFAPYPFTDFYRNANRKKTACGEGIQVHQRSETIYIYYYYYFFHLTAFTAQAVPNNYKGVKSA
jgi:hypothetical protein